MNLVPSFIPRLNNFYQNHIRGSAEMANHEERPPSETPEDSDIDAEGEEVDDDFEIYPRTVAPPRQKVVQSEVVMSIDAEGEDEEEGRGEDEDDHDEDAAGETDDEDAETEESSEPEGNASWQDSGGEDEVDDRNVDADCCVFCGEPEDRDPSEVWEEYLECNRCNEHAHPQCARNNDALEDDDDVKQWKCARCLKLPDEVDITNTPADHLPPDESISATDDEQKDGSRSLRKRKNSETEISARGLRKRRRASIDLSDNQERAESQEAGGRSSSRRPRRLRNPDRPLVEVIASEGVSLILCFCLNRHKVAKILRSRPRKTRYREKMKKIQAAPIIEPEPAHYPALPPGFGNMFLGMSDGDIEEKKPYGGILTEAEADTSKTFPQSADRKRFEEARLKAEDDWKKKMADTNNAPEPNKPSSKNSGPPSKIKCINFGGFEIETWNAAPYPEEYSRNKILYICEFCLKYMNSDYVAWRHKLKCPAQHPPGDEIYREGRHSFFEVDGRKNPVYCQNLCLLAKLFLGSKTLYYDVEPFLFYVMTENDELGCHFVGYFSKEKRPSSMNNVSCILVLPIYQRRGFGHMLIEFSYLLTKREEKTGSPEKPLSDMGLVSYRGYWRLVMCYQLINQKSPLSISDLSKTTGMTPDDVISALEGLRALVRDPVTKTYAMRLDTTFFREYIDKYEKKNYPRINPDALIWTKYLMNRGLIQHYEGGGALQTVAPREEENDADHEESKTNRGLPTDPEVNRTNADVDNQMVTDNHEETSQANGDMEITDSANDGPLTPMRNGVNTRRRHKDGTATPKGDVVAVIPPTRFEVYPPFPGMFARKRGRPFGSGRKTYVTEVVGANATPTVLNPIANGSPSLRRTRSGLAELGVVDGADEVKEHGDAPEDGVKDTTMNDDNVANDEAEEAKYDDSDPDAEGEDE